MEGNILNLIDKIFSNNNNILHNIINELKQIKDDSKENITIKRLSDIIIKMNNSINENKKNTELIRNDISKLYEQINKWFNELKINNIINNKEIKYNFNNQNKTIKRIKYIGQVLNGVPEGKGIMYWNNGDRYEGDWKNDEANGKGIYYYSNGDREMRDYTNGKQIGKHVKLTRNGNIEENYY